MYKREGYTGIVITDCFLNGNTTVPRVGKWEDRVTQFCESYCRAKARGNEVGLDIFFGREYSYRGTDLITLGLSPQWLLAHPEVMDWEVGEYCDKIREAEHAAAYDLTRTAGSDAHDSGWKTLGGIVSPRRLTDEADLIALLRAREHEVFFYRK